MQKSLMECKWEIGKPTSDEGIMIVTSEFLIIDEDDGNSKGWVATAYDEKVAEWMVESHNRKLEMTKSLRE